MECGSGHEAHRCIGSGFSWGSWLLGGSRASKGGVLVAMAAGTAGAQSAGTWSYGHGRGLTKGGKGCVMKKHRPCPQGSTRKFPESNWKMLEWNRALGLRPTSGGHLSPGHMCIPGFHLCLRMSPGDLPPLSPPVWLKIPYAAAAAACREARL